MKLKLLIVFSLAVLLSYNVSAGDKTGDIRILVITGGHDYNKEHFGKMLSSLGDNISYQIAELPAAFQMFLPENRNKYDVLVFYHMWQSVTPDQAKAFSECIYQGKPLVALHHSICAFDDWPEYYRIIGGKYFHKPAVVDGKEYPACSYQHDLHFRVNIEDPEHPVTKGMKDFDVFDETYMGYYVEPGVKVLLTTDESTSNKTIGWTKKYGKAQVVTIQSGHDVPTFGNESYRQILRQSVLWVYEASK